MSDQLISDGTYAVRGPYGHLTAHTALPGMAMLEPDDSSAQQWKVAAESGGHTVRNVATGLYLGNDGPPDDPQMTVKGTSTPFIWTMSAGDDGRETTLVLTSAASSDGLVLTMSMLRTLPPLVAILPSGSYSTIEWSFDAV